LTADIADQGIDLGGLPLFQVLEHRGPVVEGGRDQGIVEDPPVFVAIGPEGAAAEGSYDGEGLVDNLIHHLLCFRPFRQRPVVNAENCPEGIEGAVIEEFGEKRLVDVGHRHCRMTGAAEQVGEQEG